ncbi:SPLICING FACTOR PROLINE- AND GLUTAMINE-RICH-LIKE [Salix koriyanagi]|uniref:SPLICING FACTOR PROLINE- AND GLUTAMINE-RICH-LIKE n=1 Tax=Salix koriyanagi TaxID=2511006 RepID=A0A9Q0QLU1_9ROSI|nr:SPLICING FACTOR PROLINE- AND GLUTAMINE-RICH-LIKE [Salix koriyanagi]
MEAFFAPSTADHHQSISPYKQMKNPNPTKKINHTSRGFISRSAENLPPMNYNSNSIHGGLFFAPPRTPQPRHNSLPSLSRGLSCPPTATRKTNRPRDQSFTPKKSKQPNIKKEEPKKKESFIIESTVPLGPDPKDLPKYVSKVLSSSVTVSGNDVITKPVLTKDFDPKFPDSVFTPSPHPSSLPLPKFSMKPKRGCTAEAAGVDTGATDNLRRILRLR